MPASFNFPHTGKLLSLSFVLFAGWFADAPVPLSRLSAAGARRARQLLRQPHRGGAVSARPVPDSSRHVSAVSRDRRHQLARRVARRGGAHAHGGAARRLRRHRPPSLAARTAPVVRRHHRGARGRGPRRHAPALCDRAVPGVFEGQGAGVDAAAARTGRRDRGAHAVSGTRHEPAAARDHRRAQGAARRLPARRAAVRLLQSGAATWWASTSSSRIAWRARWASPWPSCRSIATGWRSNSRRGTATS